MSTSAFTFPRCDRCGCQHEPGPLWQCKRCEAILCERQVNRTMGLDRHGMMITESSHSIAGGDRLENANCGPVRKRMLQFGFEAVPDMQDFE